MASATFRVARCGPLCSIQDAGRRQLKRFGVPGSGPMDRLSFAAAHAALGQELAAAVEISLGGMTLECLSGGVTVAITGGHFHVGVDDRYRSSWCVLTVSAGDRLTVRPGPWGTWAYLAFLGALQAPYWLGSQSTHSLSGLGGGLLSAGSELTIDNARFIPEIERDLICPVMARPRRDFNLVLGPQDRYFSGEALANLVGEPFLVSDSYDRMGVRLRGPLLPPVAALSIPSEATCRGSVQVSGDGVPTILLADHQTTGGYPKIATLVSDEIDRLVQVRPRSAIAFRAIEPAQAVAMVRRRAPVRQRYFDALAEEARQRLAASQD